MSQTSHSQPSMSNPSQLSMTGAVRSVLRQYARFSGRATLAEYWWWQLALVIAFVAWNVLYRIVAATMRAADMDVVTVILGVGVLLTLAVLVLGAIVPSVAVTVRRLHDTGKPGSWAFLALIPAVGWIILLVLTATGGTAGPNLYGADPLGRPPVQVSAPTAAQEDVLERLRRLGELRASGVLSDDEFARMKAEIITR